MIPLVFCDRVRAMVSASLTRPDSRWDSEGTLWSMVTLTSEAAIHEIKERLARTGESSPLLIAVDGHSAAGKSTFARQLVQTLDAALVPGDDFYQLMEPEERFQLGPAEGAERYYDWERMRDQVLKPLHEGRAARYRPYDWERDTLESREITITPRPMVVAKGLFVSRPEFDSLNSLTVLVVADPDVRRQRQLDRADASAAWLRRWDAAERWYFDRVRPPEHFDVIVNGLPSG